MRGLQHDISQRICRLYRLGTSTASNNRVTSSPQDTITRPRNTDVIASASSTKDGESPRRKDGGKRGAGVTKYKVLLLLEAEEIKMVDWQTRQERPTGCGREGGRSLSTLSSQIRSQESDVSPGASSLVSDGQAATS